jgi:hypothetical protein
MARKVERLWVWQGDYRSYEHRLKIGTVEEEMVYFAQKSNNLVLAFVFYKGDDGPTYYRSYDPAEENVNDVLIEILSGKEPQGSYNNNTDDSSSDSSDSDVNNGGSNSGSDSSSNTDSSIKDINKILSKSQLILRVNKGTTLGADKLVYKSDKIERELNISTDSTINVVKEDTDKNEDTANWELSVSKTPGTLTVNGTSFNGSKDVNIDLEEEGTFWSDF